MQNLTARPSWIPPSIAWGLLAFAVPGLAQEADGDGMPEVHGGVYLELSGGSSYSLDQDSSFDGALGSTRGDVDFKVGFQAGGALGYRFDQIRFELASQFRRQEVESFTFDSVVGPAAGDLDVTTGLLNVLYDFDLEWPVEPYLGGGIGVARLDLDAEVRPQIFVVDDVVNEFAWNLLAGASMAVAPSTELFLHYRRLQLFDEASLDASFPGLVSGDLDMDFAANEFAMGLRYTF